MADTALSATIAGGAYPQFAYQNATATGAAGSGSFTPTNAAKGAYAMMQLRVGGCYLFRFDDGSAWEIRWGFYTGTVITRPANGFVSSSTGSALSLSANAVATVLSPLGLFQRGMGEHCGSLIPAMGSSSIGGIGFFGPNGAGTAAAVTFADTNVFTRQPQNKYTSATTANAAGGLREGVGATNATVGQHFAGRFGASQIPTAPRLLLGHAAQTTVLAGEPSALTDLVGFAKDSTDTNIQFMVNDASGTATKQDTSIALAINTLYEMAHWCDPGGATQYGLLVDHTNQAIWYGSAASNLPTPATALNFHFVGSLNGTDTGTAFIFHFMGCYRRGGA